MKRRFRNIIKKTKAGNGVAILIGITILAAGSGIFIGCSVAETSKEEGREEDGIEVPDIVLENDGMPGDELFESDLRQQLEDMGFVEAQGDENENTTLLTYTMEGK